MDQDLSSQWSLECLGEAYDEATLSAGGETRSNSRRKSLRAHLDTPQPVVPQDCSKKRRTTFIASFPDIPSALSRELLQTTAAESEDYRQCKASDAGDGDGTQSFPSSSFHLPPVSHQSDLIAGIERLWASRVKIRETHVRLWRDFFDRLDVAVAAQPVAGTLNQGVFDAWHSVGWTLVKDLAHSSLEGNLLRGAESAVPLIMKLIIEHHPRAAVFWLPRPPRSTLTQYDDKSAYPEEGPVHWWIFSKFQCAGNLTLRVSENECPLCDAMNLWSRTEPAVEVEAFVSLLDLMREILSALSCFEREAFQGKRMDDAFKVYGFAAGRRRSALLCKPSVWVPGIRLSTASVEEPIFAFIRALLVPLMFSPACVIRLQSVRPEDAQVRDLWRFLLQCVEALVECVRADCLRNGLVAGLPRLMRQKLNSWKISMESPDPCDCCYRFDSWIKTYDFERAIVLFLDYTLFAIHTRITHSFNPKTWNSKDAVLSDVISDFKVVCGILWQISNLTDIQKNHLEQPWWSFCLYKLKYTDAEGSSLHKPRYLGCTHSVSACSHTIPLCVPSELVIHLFAHSGRILPQFGIYDTPVKGLPLIKVWLDANHVLGCALRSPPSGSLLSVDRHLRARTIQLLDWNRSLFIASVRLEWKSSPVFRIMGDQIEMDTDSHPLPAVEVRRAIAVEKCLMIEICRLVGTLYTYRNFSVP